MSTVANDSLTPIRIGNFMDSPLEDLEKKGNLSEAVRLYNPNGGAERVVHFTPSAGDLRFRDMFAENRIDLEPYFRVSHPTSRYRRQHLPEALGHIYRVFKSRRINVVRGRLPYVGSLLGCSVARLLGIPSVVSLGGDNRISQEQTGRYYFGSRRLSYGWEAFVLRLCDVIIAPNAFTQRYVARIIGAEPASRKVTIIPWILPESMEIASDPDLLSALGLEPTIPLVLTVGFLNEYKHSDIMFEVALRSSVDSPSACQFAFCGDGPLRKRGEETLGHLPNVHFLGFRKHDTVLKLIKQSTAVLVPMSGFVLLEAAAIGTPVIVSNLEWHSEVIQDGRTGYIVRARSVEDWHEKLRCVLADTASARAMAKRLRHLYRAHYDPKMLLDKELALYRELVDRPK